MVRWSIGRVWGRRRGSLLALHADEAGADPHHELGPG